MGFLGHTLRRFSAFRIGLVSSISIKFRDLSNLYAIERKAKVLHTRFTQEDIPDPSLV